MCLLKGWSFRGAVSAHAVKLTTPFRLLFVTAETKAATGTGIHNYIDFIITPGLHIVEPGNLVSDWG